MIAILGANVLAAALHRALAPCHILSTDALPDQIPASTTLLLWCRDGRDWAQDIEVQQRLRAQPLPYLPLWRIEDEIWLGPRGQGAAPGCICCLRRRLRNASLQKTEFDQYDRIEAVDTPALLPPLTAIILGGLIQEEAAHLADGRPGAMQEAVFSIALPTVSVRRHPLVPDAACPTCGRLPEDTPSLPFTPGRRIIKEVPASFRTLQRPPDLAALQARFVDYRTGIMPNLLRHPHRNWLPLSEVQLGMYDFDHRQYGYGRESDYLRADLVALLEALERYAGIHQLARQHRVKGSYRELAADAIDPTSLILHSPVVYTNPAYCLNTYTPDLPLRWVWAYSFTQGRPLLVPEQAVYYGAFQETDGTSRFLIETSSGCALGGCLEEAIFYGLLEIIERDAILLWWYAQLPAQRLDLGALRDPAMWDLIDRAEQRGYRVDAFNITSDIPVPVILVLVRRPDGQAPLCAVAGGAHPDPLRALRGGMLETVSSIAALPTLYALHAHRLPALQNPKNVQTLEDHRLRQMIPSIGAALVERLLTDQAAPFESALQHYSWPIHPDFQEDLQRLVGLVRAVGLDVLVVDQTPPELRSVGLFAARVIVPGALPLTSGHDRRRVDENGRVRTAPVRMGYDTPRALNLLPHPLS